MGKNMRIILTEQQLGSDTYYADDDENEND